MNVEIDKTNQIIELFRDAKSIAITPSKVAGVDAFAAGVGLYFVLKEDGKNVSLIYPGSIPEEFEGLNGLDLSSNASQRELVVSVDYSGTEASKVNYSTNDDVLQFSLGPIDKDFDLSRIRTSIVGCNFDLIVTIGAQVLEDLGKTYNDLESEFSKVDVLNIDNTDRNQRFGNINVVDSSSDSLSLLVLNKSVNWNFRLTTKSAEALLKGIAFRKGI